MTNETPDNPPAFPRAEFMNSFVDAEGRNNFHVESAEGMTLRDYFAAAALTGMAESYNVYADERTVDLAEAAYRLANAMLAARSR
jgi:hypothetical protein